MELTESLLRVCGQGQDLLRIVLHNPTRFRQDDAFSYPLQEWNT
jgi:hypothetical protein